METTKFFCINICYIPWIEFIVQVFAYQKTSALPPNISLSNLSYDPIFKLGLIKVARLMF